ncbi:MAG: sigma-54-dependent Fis family transcriptional regulator, partial [Gammaproteobacteria bacterium]|nr:sigma-54-dependent Fis family transcriptional regulator [Gammaproteobacteria bacterium]NIW46834.1 sigma-54-dependent Fis family transcriptional regulator [Gammaproteobacteria bacterium]NIW99524.1 sigma-54-dependent Fis family transcriptional regulator [Phycisphaerae bacterium]
EAKEIKPLGTNTTINIDVRLVAATNKVLMDEVENGNFREDLYYRLNIVDIKLPSLSERKEDIPLLV